MTSKVVLDVSGHIATITVNNPPMNPLDMDVMGGLKDAFDSLLLEEDIRAVILTGEGKAFIAGADIKELKKWTPETSLYLNGKGQQLVNIIEHFPCPVIAAVNGYALGGGLEIAMGCDIRILSSRAKVGLPEARLGIIPGYGGTVRLPKCVSLGMAKKMIFTAAHITAEEALRIGLAEEVTEPEMLMKRAREMAEEIAKNAPLSVRAVKRLINDGRGRSVEENLRAELEEAKGCYASHDSDIGIDAFINKEEPVFFCN